MRLFLVSAIIFAQFGLLFHKGLDHHQEGGHDENKCSVCLTQKLSKLDLPIDYTTSLDSIHFFVETISNVLDPSLSSTNLISQSPRGPPKKLFS